MDVKDSIDYTAPLVGERYQYCTPIGRVCESRNEAMLLQLLDLARDGRSVDPNECRDIGDAHGVTTSMVKFEQDDDGGSVDSKIRLSQQPFVHLGSRQRLSNRLQSHLELVDRPRSVRRVSGRRTYFHQATIVIVQDETVTRTGRSDV